MKKVITLSAMLASLMFTSAAAAELKVAVLDIQKALMSTQAAQDRLEEMRSDLEGEQQTVQALTQDIKDLREQMQRDSEVMSDQRRRELVNELESKQQDFRYQRQKLQKQVQNRQRALMQDMSPKLNAALQEVREDEGYDLVLPSQSLLWSKPAYDITAKVTEALDENG